MRGELMLRIEEIAASLACPVSRLIDAAIDTHVDYRQDATGARAQSPQGDADGPNPGLESRPKQPTGTRVCATIAAY